MSSGVTSKLVEIGRATLPQLAVLLTALLVRAVLGGVLLYAQLLTCPNPDSVTNLINAVSTTILVAVVMIVVFLVIFNIIGTVSTVAMRIGEFFNERMRFVFELLVIYVLMLWGLSGSDIIGNRNNCAVVDFDKLLSSGPLMFRIIGEAMKWLGLRS